MPRPASDIAARVVDAARERFLIEGVDGASLRRIADDAHTNIGMIYYYFKTKDDLFLAVVEDVYEKLLHDLVLALRADVPSEQRFARMFERVAAIDEREFQVVRLIMREALVSSTRLTRLAQRFAQGHVPLVIQALAEGMQQRRFDPEANPIVIAAATAALAVLPQIAHRLVSSAGLPLAELLPDRKATAQSMLDILLFGIAGSALRPDGKR